tara:strand:+ start:886 stop:2238 length:1353 start_codon:yes stop_codon:yes gene_type:complete
MALILPNSIFVHIPNTGGAWVRKAIEASMGIEKDSSEIEIYGIDKWGKKAHARISDIKRELKEDLEKKFVFSFVRKPLDILKSMYISDIYPWIVDFDGYKQNNYEKITFKQFVHKRGPSFVTSIYLEYLEAPIGVFPYVDYIGRTENLKDDLIEALEMAGEDFDRKKIEDMPPVGAGASLEKAKELIHCDEDILEFIKDGERLIDSLFYSDDSYSNLQKFSYDKLASLWGINKRDFVVGSFDSHNRWKDYDLLFDGMFDFHNNTEHLPLAKDCLLLDFGCGPGRNLEKYGANFKRVDGVDISHINLYNTRYWLDCTDAYKENLLFNTNGRDLREIESNQYDAVMSTITLQHIPVHEIRFGLFKEFYRVLKSSGWFTAQMGFGKGKFGSVDYYKNHYNAGTTNGRTDVYVESPEQLKGDLEKIGFSEFEYKIRVAGPGDTHPNWIFFRAKK